MWIVLFALRYKYTIGVLAISIFLAGMFATRRMSTDIMPRVDAPEIQLVWSYGGLNAREMAAKITSFSEIATLNNVDDLVEVRSDTTNGVAIVKLRFQPYVEPELALAQATAVSQTILRRMPTGTTPPIIVRTSPSSVPILQLVIASETLTDGALFDYARLGLRSQVQSIPGIRMTLPYGGASRQIMVDLDPQALNSFGITAAEVSRAIASQNLTLPSGTVREGERELPLTINSSPDSIAQFMDLPLRSVDGRLIRVADVANVRDGEAVASNIARLNGQNAVIVSVLKLGNASTLDIINAIRERLPAVRAAAPEGITIEPIFDQSVFVAAAIKSIIKEIIIVGGLVAFMVLLFLGSWRSTLIVLTSIPLALLCSVTGLYLTGETFNLMSLGGLALAIGILVDNALVEIENIKRNVAMGKSARQAILDGAQQVAFPEFVSTTGICIVFTPIFLLSGTAADVFRPLALAVIYAMISSYVLSRTLVPTLASMLLPAELRAEAKAGGKPGFGFLWIAHKVEHGIDFLAAGLRAILRGLTRFAIVVPIIVLGIAAGGYEVFKGLGREFFPTTDAGLMRLFVRVPSGTRVEKTAEELARIQQEIRTIIPASELRFIVENIGMPAAVNMAWVESNAVGPYDGEILIQLADEHRPTAEYMAALRTMLDEKFPEVQAFFRPADVTGQTLSGGAPTTFEVRFIGRDVPGNLALARSLAEQMEGIPGAVDVTFKELLDLPEYYLETDLVRAAQLGVSQQDVVSALLTVLGSGNTVTPSLWADPRVGASYDVQVMVPPNLLVESDQLLNLPVRPSAGGDPVLLGAFAKISERRNPASVSRTTLQPTMTILANVQGTGIGSVQSALAPILAEMRSKQKPGNRIEVAGQAALMESAYGELLGGLALASVLIFLVMVVNFQSWSMPFAAISGLPIAVTGAMIALAVTNTPLSVPALMGVIMVIGLSTANSVLVTSFARDLWLEGLTGREAAIEAAATRLRPVMMTALTMILGVMPMAYGLGEGGEQNAPLARAVIGGLSLGTFASLLVVPVAFAILKRRPATRSEEDEPAATASEATDSSPTISPTEPEMSPTFARTTGIIAVIAGTALMHPAIAQQPTPAPPAAAATTSGVPLRTVAPQQSTSAPEIKLPARTAPMQEADIFSRITGIIAERSFDIGDRVKAGDVLAKISAPEVEDEIAHAKAAINQVKVRLDLARTLVERGRDLASRDLLPQEELDTREANLRTAEADLVAAETQLARLETTRSFQTIRAPFDAVVAERGVDVGDHVEGDSNGAENRLYRLVRLNELRVLIDAPPSAALALRPGQKADLRFRELGDRAFEATITRASQVIDGRSGTMRVEAVVANEDLALPAGLSGFATIKTGTEVSVLEIPVNALRTREGRSTVATVEDGRVRFVEVALGRNLGNRVEVRSGLRADASVILSPNALLKEGDEVK